MSVMKKIITIKLLISCIYTFKVCEKHFKPDDIIRHTTFFDEKIGRSLTAPLAYPKLKENAVPKVLPNCPAYLSGSISSRESADDRRFRLENEQVQQALNASLISEQSYQAEKSFSNFPEFLECFKKHKYLFNRNGQWVISEEKEEVLFSSIVKNPIPKIRASVIVDNTCSATIFII